MIPQDAGGPEFPPELAPAAAALKRLVSALGTHMPEAFSHLNLTLPQFRVLHLIRKEGRDDEVLRARAAYTLLEIGPKAASAVPELRQRWSKRA